VISFTGIAVNPVSKKVEKKIMININDITNRLPSALYRADQVRAMDRFAIDTLGIPGIDLMQRAGEAAFRILRAHWSGAQRVAVVCGAGNNGGDGYVVAHLAKEAGLDVRIFSLVPVERLRGDALTVCRSWQAAGGAIQEYGGEGFEEFDLVVDALLGTGLDRPVSGRYGTAIEAVNRFHGPALALDIPSGLHADTGSRLGCAVEADHTVTFIGLKQGLFTGDGPECCGTISFSSLGVPPEVQSSQQPSALLSTRPDSVFAPRRRSAHKGHFGHVLVIGGDAGFSGAARLAAEAAARVGAGLVSVATRAAHAALINLTRPEIMSRGIETAKELDALRRRASVVAVGPGLGQSPWAIELFKAACECDLPMVVDADALNLLANNPAFRANWVLTPHPGEAARLLQTSAAEIQRDRFAAVRALQERYGGVCVLKGAGSLTFDSTVTTVNTTGNPGMASGGMGDVLSGVAAGLIAQGLDPADAARAAVALHGAAADRAAIDGERGMLAGDLMQHLRALVNR
jgi:ADP-dependent NAD(P)H-hydrate dehydratase / NAD(P)H-hydrate epimerase